MAKDPAVLFYTSDFISGTLLMTDDQKGKYIILLCLQHQKGKLSEEDMYKICKTYDKEVFEKFIKDDAGFYINVRMKEETDKRRKYSESRANNRKSLKNQDNYLHMLNISNSYEKHMENENENINEDININKNINEKKHIFDKFWDLYDKKRGNKEKIFSKWLKLKKEDIELIFKYIPEYKKAQPDKQYRKDPETFLNNKSWNDEIIVSTTNNKPERITNSKQVFKGRQY